MNYYYLYLIKFEDGKLYIGSRKSEVPAVEDTNYWGSPGKTIKHLWEMKKEKYILFESTDISLQDLREKEYKMIDEGWKKYGKEKCINKNCGGLNNIDIEVIKESGKRCRDQKLGIFGWTVEEWSKNSKEKWHSNKNARGFMSWDEEKIKEFRVNQRKKFCKTYTFINPSGGKIVVNDLPKFCKEMGLVYASMLKVFNDKSKHHQGWSKNGLNCAVNEIIKRNLNEKPKEPKNEKPKEPKNEKPVKIIISPEGKEVEIINLTDFCKKNNLCMETLRKVLKGEFLQHKNWSLCGPEKLLELKEELFEKRYEEKLFYGPSGKQIIINCFSTFARKNNLNLHCLRLVYIGEMLQHKGYSVLHPDEVKKEKQKLIDLTIKRTAKTVKMKNPEGQIMEIYNLVGFCKENGLNPGNMHNVLTGRKKSCKGWTRP